MIEPVNDVFSIYSTNGSQADPTTALTPFFTGQSQIDRTNVVYGPFLSDPRCYFDPSNGGHFFMTILQINTDPSSGDLVGQSYEDVAVSKTATPTTSTNDWWFYSIDTTDNGGVAKDSSGRKLPTDPGCPCFGDQPLLGADQYGFYITSNEYSIAGPEFNGAQVYAFDKNSLESGTLKYEQVNTGALSLAEGPAYSLQPATSPTAGDWDTANNGTEFLLSALDFNATTDNRIAAWALTNTHSLQSATPAVTLTAPAILSSETYGQPPNAEQKKGPTPLANAVGAPEEQLATNDDRMNQVVYAAGKLWSGVNTIIRTSNGASTQTDRTGIAYFIVQPSTPTSTSVAGTIVNQGYVGLGNHENVFYPSIGVTSAGRGVMTFTVSGKSYYPSVGYATIDAVNGAGDIHIAAAGTKPDDGFTGYAAYGGEGAGRWGDYSAAVAAPDGSVWLRPPSTSRARSGTPRSLRIGAPTSGTSLRKPDSTRETAGRGRGPVDRAPSLMCVTIGTWFAASS